MIKIFKPSPPLHLKKRVPDGPTDGRTDGRTDRPSYRDAWTHLKIPALQLAALKNNPIVKMEQ